MRLRGGGYVGTVVTPTTSAAPGVWSLADVYAARKAGTWPSVTPAPAPSLDFSNVSNSQYIALLFEDF